MITEDYCSYEVAKLLKDKGFDGFCTCCYNPKDGNLKTIWDDTLGEVTPEDWNNLSQETYNHIGLGSWFGYISAPTQAMTMKWLREVHKIFIEISVSIDLNGNYHYSYSILNRECKYVRKGYTDFNWNYEQACEAAIKYCLENLI